MENKVFGCMYCEKTFNSEVKVKTHMTEHNKEKLVCNICKEFQTESESDLVDHIVEHSFPKHACKHCGEKYMKMIDLYVHVMTLHKSCGLVCEVCSAKFLHATEFKLHVLQEHEERVSMEAELYCSNYSKEVTAKGAVSDDTVVPMDATRQHCGASKRKLSDGESRMDSYSRNTTEENERAVQRMPNRMVNRSIKSEPLESASSSKNSNYFGNMSSSASSETTSTNCNTSSLNSTHPPTLMDTDSLDKQNENSEPEMIPDIPHTYSVLTFQSEKVYTCDVCRIQCNNEKDFHLSHLICFGDISVIKSENLLKI